MLLGVKAVIAESFERIHRSNLIGMGVLPLQFHAGPERRSRWASPARRLSTSRAGSDGRAQDGHGDGHAATAARRISFEARVRIDTPKEREYFHHGGILHYVLRQLAACRQGGLTTAASVHDQPAAQRAGGL